MSCIQSKRQGRYYFRKTNESQGKFTICEQVDPPAYNRTCHTDAHNVKAAPDDEIFKFGNTENAVRIFINSCYRQLEACFYKYKFILFQRKI